MEAAGEAPYQLIRQGVPDHLRGQAWLFSGAHKIREAKGADYYTQLVHQAYLEGSEWSGDIAQDIPRTFPDHSLLCSDRGRDILNRVLLAYSLHNPKIGYCQSMNFICAFLLLHMEENSAFWTLCYIIDDHMSGYYMKGMQAVQV